MSKIILLYYFHIYLLFLNVKSTSFNHQKNENDQITDEDNDDNEEDEDDKDDEESTNKNIILHNNDHDDKNPNNTSFALDTSRLSLANTTPVRRKRQPNFNTSFGSILSFDSLSPTPMDTTIDSKANINGMVCFFVYIFYVLI